MNKIIFILLLNILLFGKAIAQPPTTHSTGIVPAGVKSEYTFGNATSICVGFKLTEKMNVNITLNCTAESIMLFKISPYSASSVIGVTNWTLDTGEYRYYLTKPIGSVSAIVCKLMFTPLDVVTPSAPIYPTGKNYIKKSSPSVQKNTISNDPSEELITIEYFDGVGRSLESVMQGLSPEKGDVITINGYDDLGRQIETWLPVVIKSNNGGYADIAKIKSGSNTMYSGENAPFSKSQYDSSPLNRILEQYGSGADWQDNKKAVKTGNLANKAKSGTAWELADSLVCGLYNNIDDQMTIFLSRTANYNSNELYVTRQKDENDNVSYQFKNKLGQIVLSRQINGGKFFDTNYIYDGFGNLRVVLPPEASDKMLNSTAWTETDANLKLYAYLYKYDNRGRCVWKKLPGCEPTYYIYDKADQLIFLQDGENRKKSEWQFTIPDAFGRIILTGICKNTLDYTVDPLKTVAVKATWIKETNTYKGYTITGITLTTPSILSVNYYDSYEFMGLNSIPAITDADIKPETITGYGVQYTGGYKGLLTGAQTALMNADGTISSTYLYSVMYYDNRDRLIQTKSSNHLAGGIEKEYISYNFAGQPVLKKHIHSATGKTTQTEIYTYTYDHAERLTKETHQLNTGAVVTLAENTYDELGRLKTNKKGGVANSLSTYSYNVRSWIKSITSPLFSQTLYYNESYGGSVKQYNGNISAMNWKQNTETNLRGYAFTYDDLSRLTGANYLENGTANTNFKAAYSYDKQGNMLTLQRYGKTTATTYGLIDNLSMSYIGNQLTKAEDAIGTISISESADFKNYSNAATEYTYNANGALVKDFNKGISEIQYNLLNLPRLMDIKSPVAEARNEYTYSADGQKRKVVQKWNSSFSTTPVIGSAISTTALTQIKTTDYVGNIIYEDSALKRILIDGGYIENGVYYYYLTDHQGNNRVVINTSGASIQRNHYYPFGTAFAENTVAEQGKQPYKYNGKELDQMHGVNLYDYSARYYESAIGRFTSVDPLAEKYYSISPYAYVANNPLKFIDPTGMAYRFIYANEEDGEKGGYYVNDEGEKVEWKEVFEWLTANKDKETDQNEAWGVMSIMSTTGGAVGHSWISLIDKDGKEKTFGTFDQGIINGQSKVNGKVTDIFDYCWRNRYNQFQVNYERDKDYSYGRSEYAVTGKSFVITNKQRVLIDIFNLDPNNTKWSKMHNCTDYSVTLWNTITKENIYPALIYRTPSGLFNKIGTSIQVHIPRRKNEK